MRKVLITDEDYKILSELVYLSGNEVSMTDIIHKTLEKTVPKELKDFILSKEIDNDN